MTGFGTPIGAGPNVAVVRPGFCGVGVPFGLRRTGWVIPFCWSITTSFDLWLPLLLCEEALAASWSRSRRRRSHRRRTWSWCEPLPLVELPLVELPLVEPPLVELPLVDPPPPLVDRCCRR